MSHVSTIKGQIKSIRSVKAACKRLNLEFLENQTTYAWYGRHVGDYPIPEGMSIEDMGKCIHAIRVPGAKYEIGIIKDPLNTKDYKFIWDFWDKSLIDQLGEDAWKLTQAYEVEQIKHTAKMQGKTLIEKKMDDRIRLVVQM